MNKRLAVVLPVAILVLILSIWYLSNNFSELDNLTRLAISIGGMVVSGAITYFLFPENERKI